MTKRRFASVWQAIESNPHEAANLRARADLMIALQEHGRRRSMTQAEAARLLHITQPRVSDLMRGKIELFSIDTLVELLGRAGASVKLSVQFRRAA
ncbi:MAG: XRE family transcriptional regulator [Betaproteobacteria bacterium]|nr:XRE family transcriptional regulator [Betaproteobacteria bacterium]